MSDRQTAIFFGHGSPMKALLNNSYTAAWQRVGQGTKKPRAILSIRTTGT
jgi:4,5-DOPA dioxygenase extradiol